MTISHINADQLRPSGDDGLGSIIQIGPDRRQEAIARLLSTGANPDRDHARRFIDFARDHRINLDGLWARLDHHGWIEATVLTVPSPGRTVMVFASRSYDESKVRSMAGLVDHAVRMLEGTDINLAQVLLDPADELERRLYVDAGFTELAILSYLERPVTKARGRRPAQPQWPQGVTTDAYDESQRGALIEVLTLTYEDTLDCPGLRGHRRTEDILEGHRASGVFDRRLWTLLRENGRAIGALLLNPSADAQTIELVYLGLIKAARGRGLGAQLLRFGLNLLQNRREVKINLAVDEANAPAMNLYVREGFSPALRRRAMIRPL